MYLLVASILVTVASVLYWIVTHKTPGHVLQRLPAPSSWPLLGHIPHMDRASANPYRQLTAWGRELGPVFRLDIGPTLSIVVVCVYEAVHEVLVEQGRVFSGRASNYRDRIFTGGHGLISVDGRSPKVQLLRRLAMNTTRTHGSRVQELAEDMMHDLVHTLEETKGQPLDPRQLLTTASLQMISLLIFGEKFGVESQEYKTMAEVLDLVNSSVGEGVSGILLDIAPWLRYLGNPIYKKMKRARDMSLQFWETALRKANEADVDSDDMTLLRTMLEHNKTCKERSAEELSSDDMRVLAFQLQMAGMASTTSSMRALLNILVHHPDLQHNIHSEIDQQLGSRGVTLEEQDRLPVTRATILELLRYTSISPLTIPHRALQDTTIQGYHVPKGTLVIADLHAVHSDPDFWQHPDIFRPDRFLDASGQLVPPDHPHRRHLFAFGGGPRGCVGEHLAIARIFLWTVAILQRFELKPEGQEPTVSCEPHLFKSSLVLSPPDFKLRFQPRS